jgi:hypothetical protein
MALKDKRHVPSVNFALYPPIKFQRSQDIKKEEEWYDLIEEYNKRKRKNLSSSVILTRALFRSLGVKDIAGLLAKYPNLRVPLKDFKHSLEIELGIRPEQLSKFLGSLQEEEAKKMRRILENE